MTTPTPEERASWRAATARGYPGQMSMRAWLVRCLDALDAADAHYMALIAELSRANDAAEDRIRVLEAYLAMCCEPCRSGWENGFLMPMDAGRRLLAETQALLKSTATEKEETP